MINTVCGFCGVGCGIVFENEKLKGIKNYPSNNSLICKKGSLQHLAVNNRVKFPLYREKKDEEFKRISWNEAIKIIAKKLKITKPKKIGFYLSGQLLNEDYYIANKLAKGFLKTNNVDTNSRMCMASAVVAHKMILGSDYVQATMEDALNSDLLIIAGANIANSHIVFFNRVKKAKKRGLKVVVIDPIFTKTAKIADLYIQIKPGKDIEFLNAVAKKLYDENLIKIKECNGFESYIKSLKNVDIKSSLKSADMDFETLEKFIKLIKKSKKIVSAWTMGLNQSSEGVYKNIALMNINILTDTAFKKNSGFLSLTGQPNAMGGREVGGLSTTLAVHLDYTSENVKKVEDFWKTNNIPKEPGLTAFEMITKGDLKVLLITHTDPIYHLPNRKKIESAFEKIDFIVEINAFKNSQTSKFSNLILPALPWGEKRGTQTNLDRLVSLINPIREPLNEAKPDWKIFCLIAKEMGFSGFDYESEEEIFEEYKKMTKLSQDLDIYKTSYKELEKKPFRWGGNITKPLTKNKKLNLIFPKKNYLSIEPNEKYPFILLTIRLENHWHSMSKTAQFIKDETDFVLINEESAKSLNLKEFEEVFIISRLYKLKLKVRYADIHPKAVAVPMHNLKINYLTEDILDPLSKEPDFNHTIVAIKRIKDD